ncbi:hypothetical protein [Streptomyces sp. NPDC008141]|uniref:hypothetical protein n=1 Tax=Streptomyces sp. NPDC008141 TaxID=3364815 RepID=UPI0036E3486A
MSRRMALWTELEHHRWLHAVPQTFPYSRGGAFAAQLLDKLVQVPSRPHRLRAADWALRLTSRPHLKALPAAARLAALALTAYRPSAIEHPGIEAGRLSRACGVESASLGSALNPLLTAGLVAGWTYDHRREEVHCDWP